MGGGVVGVGGGVGRHGDGGVGMGVRTDVDGSGDDVSHDGEKEGRAGEGWCVTRFK